MNAAEVHAWVANYNWDDGFAPIWPVVESPRTEFATALMIYWRLGGPWCEATEADVDMAPAGPWLVEAKRLQYAVKGRLLAGFYARGHQHFDPRGELSRVQIYKLRKAGVPDILLEPR
jgi:hypothetical protein